MSSTSILGPYDNLASNEKMIVSASLPRAVKKRLFDIFLPRRGAIDKVVCRCINLIDAYLLAHPQLDEFDEYTREYFVNEILNAFTRTLQTLEVEDLFPPDSLSEPRIQNSEIPAYILTEIL